MNLRESAHGSSQRIEHRSVVNGIDISRNGGLNDQLLHVDVGAVQRRQLRRVMVDAYWLDTIAVYQAGNFHAAALR